MHLICLLALLLLFPIPNCVVMRGEVAMPRTIVGGSAPTQIATNAFFEPCAVDSDCDLPKRCCTLFTTRFCCDIGARGWRLRVAPRWPRNATVSVPPIPIPVPALANFGM